MFVRIFGFFVLAFALLGTQSWAATCFSETVPPSCTNTFSPTDTTGTYDFSLTGDGILIVSFRRVLTNFTLTVSVNHTIDPRDPEVFPEGTRAVQYCNGNFDEYDFMGNKGGPNNVPQKGIDYTGLINLELGYCIMSGYVVHDPAFAHAPGPNATAIYESDFLKNYSSGPINQPPTNPTPITALGLSTDPTMAGGIPDLSSVAALDKPGANDTFEWVSPATDGQMFTAGDEIEVEFRLFDSTGNPVRDKDALLSLSTFRNGRRVFLGLGEDERARRSHFDFEEGVNEREVETEGLPPGTYYLDIISDEFSPQERSFVIQ